MSNVGRLLGEALVECHYAEETYMTNGLQWVRFSGYREPVMNSVEKNTRHPYEVAQYNALRNFTRMRRMRIAHLKRKAND